jgi:hypothetical protein
MKGGAPSKGKLQTCNLKCYFKPYLAASQERQGEMLPPRLRGQHDLVGDDSMSVNNSDPEEIEHERRIESLRKKVNELAGSEAVQGINETPPEVAEGFLNYIAAWEEAPDVTHFKQLESAGVSLPAPETLNDNDLTLKLWEVIDKLAYYRAYLHETNHLSDRALYTLLWEEILPGETKDLSLVAGTNCQIPLLGSGSEEDNELYLRFYADDEFRRQWEKDFPEEALPEHKEPPYDRDRFLPQADYGTPRDPGCEQN